MKAVVQSSAEQVRLLVESLQAISPDVAETDITPVSRGRQRPVADPGECLDRIARNLPVIILTKL